MTATTEEEFPLMSVKSIKGDKNRSYSVVSTPFPEQATAENDRSILHQNARQGNARGVEEILKKNPSLANVADRDGMTALHYASRYGRLDVIQVLLDKNAIVFMESNDRASPLHMAAKYCREHEDPIMANVTTEKRLVKDVITALIAAERAQSVNPEFGGHYENLDRSIKFIDSRDAYQLTSLHYASMKNNILAAEALISLGATIDSVSTTDDDTEDSMSTKMTPLLTACAHGANDVAEMLLANGASIDLMDSRNNTAFHIAAKNGNVNAIRLLLKYDKRKKGWKVRENNEEKTPLILAVEGNHPETTEAILDIIIEQNSRAQAGKPRANELKHRLQLTQEDLTQIKWTENEKMLLHQAARQGYFEVFKVLVKYGAEIDRPDDDMQRPIHLAARANHPDIIEFIAELRPDQVHSPDEYGLTPLLVSAGFKSKEACQKLIELGADRHVVDNEGRNMVYIGAKFNSFNVLETLRVLPSTKLSMINQTENSQMTAMHSVATNGYIDVMRLLKENGADIDKKDEDEKTPIHYAAENGQTGAVRLLLEWKRTMVHNKDEMGNTPLHYAAKGGHDVATAVLIEAGADIESLNTQNETPLMTAVSAGRLETVRQLVWKGAQLQDDDNPGSKTPLHIAAERGKTDIVAFLLSSNAEIDRKEHRKKKTLMPNGMVKEDTEMLTALDLAISMGHRDVARVLVSADDECLLMACDEEFPVGRNQRPRNTPLRQLIGRFPDVAGLVLDKCYKTTTDSTVDDMCCVNYDFHLIDDTYLMPKENHTKILSTKISPYEEGSGPDRGKLKKGARAFSDDYHIVNINHPLKIMANSGQLDLLKHPVVLALIKHKWNSLGRYVYYFALFIYILFITLYTMFIATTPAPFNVMHPANGSMLDFSDSMSDNEQCRLLEKPRPISMICRSAVIILAIAQLVKECFQLYQRRLSYLTFDNALEIFIFSSALLTTWNFNECSAMSGVRESWQWYLTALCSFLAYINLLLLVRKLPRFGIYVVMFFDIMRTFMRFSIIFVLFVMAFSVAFYVLLQNKPEFSSIPHSMMKTTVMMIGEYEFTGIFHSDDGSHDTKLFGYQIAFPLFMLFCIVMTILLMNLLVGLAVDDIKGVQEKAELKRLSMQVDLVLQIETSMPYIRKETCRKTWMKLLRDRFGFASYGNDEVDYAATAQEEFEHEVKREMQSQTSQIQNIQSNIDHMYEKQVQLEAMLRTIMKELHVKFEEQDI